MHKEEDEALGQLEAPVYTAPKYEIPVYQAPKYEAPDANELRKLTREVRDINGAMNDFSSSTMKEIKTVKYDILEMINVTQKVVNNIDNEVGDVISKIEADFTKIVENVNTVEQKNYTS